MESKCCHVWVSASPKQQGMWGAPHQKRYQQWPKEGQPIITGWAPKGTEGFNDGYERNVVCVQVMVYHVSVVTRCVHR